MRFRWSLWIGLLAVGCVWALQFQSVRRLRSEVAALHQQWAAAEPVPTSVAAPAGPSPAPRYVVPPADPAVAQRLAGLEEAVRELTAATDYLMERGQIPLGARKIQDLYRRFADASASDADRLQALRLLRRDGELTDQGVYQALAWLDTATNARTKRELLQRLDGLTNAALKTPLLNLATSAADGAIREEAVENLRHFVDDPHVRNTVWEVMFNDPSENVRDEAADTLRRVPLSETRVAALHERLLQPEATLDERLMALEVLRRGDAASTEIMAVMAGMAQQSQDPAVRARIFRALDGSEDPVLTGPLVQGLQDPNPVVREEAADALSNLSADPGVEQWLRYVADNDVDPRVQREALQALQNRERRR